MADPAADRQWLEQALALAALTDGGTSPNPRVGCLLVRDGRSVGRGGRSLARESERTQEEERGGGRRAGGAASATMLEKRRQTGGVGGRWAEWRSNWSGREEKWKKRRKRGSE